jgi:hypothetical protein
MPVSPLAALTKEGAQKAVATMRRKGILSAKARKAWATRRAQTARNYLEEREDSRAQMIAEILAENMTDRKSVKTLSQQLLRGADTGLEISSTFSKWIQERFRDQLIWLDKDDYSRALVRALWLAPVFAATDFGGSRQRDMGQVWTDTARGFLGEIALSKFLTSRYGIEVRLDTSRGKLEKFLTKDIAEVRDGGSQWRKPGIKISVKTTKFNGRWLDLPGAQFEHSDVFVLVKIGILRQHFLAFLKAISFLKDKLFVSARNLGEISEEDAVELWNEIPEFELIPAYIAGFLDKRTLTLPIDTIEAKVVGRKKKRIVISQGVGLFSQENVRQHPKIQGLDPSGRLPIEIEPIIDSLTGTHFLAHSGGLQYGKDRWDALAGLI